MTESLFLACLPWLAGMVAGTLGILAIGRFLDRQPLNLSVLRRLHGDDRGAVQSLAFVLTLPVLVMLLLFIVQMSQLTIATVTVHYAAYAAARAAVVWIPADVSDMEPPNVIGVLTPVAPVPGADGTSLTSPAGNNAGDLYVVEPGTLKWEKIRQAAVLGCLSISPSRDAPGGTAAASGPLERLYAAFDPASTANPRIVSRLRNKLAYASANTLLEMRVFHPAPRVQREDIPVTMPVELIDVPDLRVGYDDVVIVTVTHAFALLPGPGRLLSRPVVRRGESVDRLNGRILQTNGVYVTPVTATITLVNEGMVPVLRYVSSLTLLSP